MDSKYYSSAFGVRSSENLKNRHCKERSDKAIPSNSIVNEIAALPLVARNDANTINHAHPDQGVGKPRTTKKLIATCPLCGRSFDAAAEKACSACSKKKNCPLVICPNCYHEFLP